jgi:hypothetical protein
MPDSLPGLKPDTSTGPARPSATAKPSTSVASQPLSDDATQVLKSCYVINFMNNMHYHEMKPQNGLKLFCPHSRCMNAQI